MRRRALLPLRFFLHVFLLIPSVVFALFRSLFSVPISRRNSDSGSPSRLFSPIPTTALVVWIRDRVRVGDIGIGIYGIEGL